MRVELGLHFFGQRRALFFLGLFQSVTRTVLSGLFILRRAGEGFAGFAKFYDIVLAQSTAARS